MVDKLDLMPLSGSTLPPIAGAKPVPGNLAEQVVEISLWLRRRPTDKPLPNFQAGKYEPIPRADFAEGWGASAQDIETVMECLKYIDARIERLDDTAFGSMRARRLLSVKGPLQALKTAFGTEVRQVRLATGEIVLERTGAIGIPTALEGIVLGVFGLDTRPIGTRGRVQVDHKAAASGLPTPPQIADLYKFPKPKGTAKGQVIALMQFGGGYDKNHVYKYCDDLAIRHPTLQDVCVLTGSNATGSPYDKEVTLDLEVAASVAEEATLVTYFAPHNERGWLEAISKAVHDTQYRPTIMSISWGAPELGTSNTLTWTPRAMKAMSQLFVDAASVGMTVLAACGDDGADCKVGDWNSHVPYPASDPLVLACGGTSIEDFVGKPHQETAWEFGGGGISDVYPVPAYQDASALPLSHNTLGKARGVPDISGYAAPGYQFWMGQAVVLSGTSLVAPLYAAAVARRNAKVGTPAGYLHPTLYGNSALIRDIDDPVSNGTSNSLNGAPGYYGRKGWDARTGLGVYEPGP
ncbi:MAG: S53 family peptidase [Reyranellaceae bacterium]